MEPNVREIAKRIIISREDLGITPEEMAEATGRSVEDYLAMESGQIDFDFTFLYKCAHRFGVDVMELIIGEPPHLTGYALTRAGEGISINRKDYLDYQHMAPFFKDRLVQPFMVTAPFVEGETDEPHHLAHHEGQEMDLVIEGRLRFFYDDHSEDMGPGDFVLYDSSHPHDLVAIDGANCTFLAVVIPPNDPEERAE